MYIHSQSGSSSGSSSGTPNSIWFPKLFGIAVLAEGVFTWPLRTLLARRSTAGTEGATNVSWCVVEMGNGCSKWISDCLLLLDVDGDCRCQCTFVRKKENLEAELVDLRIYERAMW